MPETELFPGTERDRLRMENEAAARDIAALRADLARQSEEIARLRGYVQHKPQCATRDKHRWHCGAMLAVGLPCDCGGTQCDCGLSALLSSQEDQPR